MNSNFYAFGEILWDCLPSGRHAGGAPFNVAAHLSQLGASASLISAVGQDALGDEILAVAGDKGVDIRQVSRARAGLPTGTVLGAIDPQGNATYEIVQPAAWDEIPVPDDALAAVSRSRGLIYGSLAARSPYNVGQLDRLLALTEPMKFFDVNLRPPFANPEVVIALARRADVIKLNDEEIGRLAAWIRTGEATLETPQTDAALAETCAVLSKATQTHRICVTRGPDGAAFWNGEELICAPAPPVSVKDTVGAGDAFMAGLVVGLTSGMEIPRVLENACRLGAFVASHYGATPLFPAELIAPLKQT